MASALAAKLNQCAVRITTANAESNAASCFSAWLSIHQLLQEYFTVSSGVEQSEEVKESQEKFAWNFVELREFPLRQLLPLAGKTIAQFPSETALALLIADFCVDACRQNVLAKMAAMESGIISGLCKFAARLAAAVRRWDLPNEPFLERTALVIYRIFEALHMITESPTFGFYSKSLEVKREFFSKAKKAWGEVDIGESILKLNKHYDLDRWGGLQGTNHALFLTLFCFTNLPADESNEHYLSLQRNIAEAWDFQFPSDNRDFLRFIGVVYENMDRQASLLDEDEAALFPELLVILKRTLNPEAVPYDHTFPYFTPALNESMNDHGRVPTQEQILMWNDWRENETRKDVRNEALKIRVQQQSELARERRNIIRIPMSREGVLQADRQIDLSGHRNAASESNSVDQKSELQSKTETSSSTREESQPTEQGGPSGHGGTRKGDHGRLRKGAESLDVEHESETPQDDSLHTNGDVRNGKKAVEESRTEAPEHAEIAAGIARTAAEKHKEAEDIREEAQGPRSAGHVKKERGGERVCGWCSKKQKERAPGAPKFKKCARCEHVFYCNAECQTRHWSVHKQACSRS